MSESIADRFAKLRSLRNNLCKKEENWQKAFDIKDWMADQMVDLLKMIRDQNVSRDDIEDRVEDILCVLDPDNKEIDDDE
tara:strand:- start:164 stop:403 length:240 start_codon:yes stop_codon:yes gene_type:complete